VPVRRDPFHCHAGDRGFLQNLGLHTNLCISLESQKKREKKHVTYGRAASGCSTRGESMRSTSIRSCGITSIGTPLSSPLSKSFRKSALREWDGRTYSNSELAGLATLEGTRSLAILCVSSWIKTSRSDCIWAIPLLKGDYWSVGPRTYNVSFAYFGGKSG